MPDRFKRLVKLAISTLFYFWSSVCNLLRALIRAEVPPTCVVLCYHSVTPGNRANFVRHLETVLRLTIPLPAGNRHRLIPGKRYSVITIDDGFQSANQNAIPELVQRKIPVTVFISPDLLGTTPKWTTFDNDELSNEQIVSADELKRWPADIVTIGSHTLTHPWLPSATDRDAKSELSGSRTKLTELLSRDTDLFSFPYGASNERLIAMCREAGYRRVFTIIPNLAFADPEEFVTGRLKADPTDWPVEFRLKLLGAYRWLPTAFAWKRKLSRRPQISPAS